MNKLMKNSIAAVLVSLMSLPMTATNQNRSDFEQEVYMLEVSGVMTVNGTRATDYMVYMFEDGVLNDSFHIDNRREQYFGFEFGHNYAMEFVKDGYKKRVLLIDTHLPQDAYSSNFHFRYEIEFIGKDVSNTFDDFPVAYITYDAKKKDFDYNRKYHNNVRYNAGQPAVHTASQSGTTADVE